MTDLPPHALAVLGDLAAPHVFDPLGWAQIAFPWGEPGPLVDDKLRAWQREVLGWLTTRLSDPATRYQRHWLAVASGHGIGKSATMGILANWAMTCHPGARVLVTANTEGQLRTKTSPEFAKWGRMSVSAGLFNFETLRIAPMDAALRENWRLDFTAWSVSNTVAFQGLHNKGGLILVMVDEGSEIPDTLYDVIEGAGTDEDTIVILIVFGNPTANTGRFREMFRKYSHLWKTWNIDSRTVEGTDKDYLQQLVDTHGEDSDYVRVRVRGQFPRASSRQFVPEDLVLAAMGKHLRDDQYGFAPVILTCDPAWTGDDALVIGFRQGLLFDVLETIPKNDNDIEVAQKLAAYEAQYSAAAVFIDAGYGTGIKSAGDVMGRNWELVWFGGKPTDPGYLRKRDEIWGLIEPWLRAGGSIPDDRELFEDLTGPLTVPRFDGRVALESKEDMRKRGLRSPNKGDALALSFARPVKNLSLVPAGRDVQPVIQSDTYDPFG